MQIYGCCVIVDEGLIYKTSDGYRFISLKDDNMSKQSKTISELNDVLNKIDAKNLGNGVILDKDHNNSDKTNSNFSSTNEVSNPKSKETTTTESKGKKVESTESTQNTDEIKKPDNSRSQLQNSNETEGKSEKTPEQNKENGANKTGDSTSLFSFVLGPLALLFGKKIRSDKK